MIDYGYEDAAAVSAFGPPAGTLLAAGMLVPEPDARVEGVLTAGADLPIDALMPFQACPTAQVSPPTLGTTGFPFLVVGDEQELRGLLVRADLSGTPPEVVAGDTVYVYVLADRHGTVTGSCDDGWTTTVYEVSLREGWNLIALRVDAADEFGFVTRETARAVLEDPLAPWYFLDLALLGTHRQADAGRSGDIVGALRARWSWGD